MLGNKLGPSVESLPLVGPSEGEPVVASDGKSLVAFVGISVGVVVGDSVGP